MKWKTEYCQKIKGACSSSSENISTAWMLHDVCPRNIFSRIWGGSNLVSYAYERRERTADGVCLRLAVVCDLKPAIRQIPSPCVRSWLSAVVVSWHTRRPAAFCADNQVKNSFVVAKSPDDMRLLSQWAQSSRVPSAAVCQIAGFRSAAARGRSKVSKVDRL